MGIVIRQSIKATIVSYAGACIGALLVIYIYPKSLTPEQIGLTRILMEAALLFTSFAQLGTSYVAIKFYPYFKDPAKNDNGFTFLVFAVPLAGFVLFTVIFSLFQSQIGGLFSQNSALFVKYLFFVIPLTLFTLYTTIAETYASLLQRIVVPKFIKEILIRILTIALIIAFYWKWISLDQFVVLFVLMYGAATVLNLIYLHSIKPLRFQPDFSIFQGPLKNEILRFTSYVVAVGIGAMVASRIDVFMLSNKLNLGGAGIFTIAFFIASFIEMPSRAIFQMITPFTSDALKNDDMTLIDSLYKRTSLNQLIIAGLLFLLIWINAGNIFRIMPNGSVFETGKYVIFFIGLAKVFDALTGINAIILGNSKYYYYTLYFIFVLAVITVGNNLYFIPIWGVVGSAFSTFISIVLYNLILVIFVKWKLGVQPFTKQTVYAFLSLGFAYGCSYAIPALSHPIADMAVRSAVVGGIFLFTIYWFNVSDDITTVIRVGVKRAAAMARR